MKCCCILYCTVLVYTGLGHVVPELGVKEEKIFPKTCFSMVLPEVEEYMKQYGGEMRVQLYAAWLIFFFHTCMQLSFFFFFFPLGSHCVLIKCVLPGYNLWWLTGCKTSSSLPFLVVYSYILYAGFVFIYILSSNQKLFCRQYAHKHCSRKSHLFYFVCMLMSFSLSPNHLLSLSSAHRHMHRHKHIWLAGSMGTIVKNT